MPSSPASLPESGSDGAMTEALFENAIHSIPALVWTARADGFVDFLNQRWQDYTGLDLEIARGWGWQAAIHPDDVPGLLAYWHGLLASRQSGDFEARLRRVDGEYRWFSLRAESVLDADGAVEKWYGTVSDVDDRHASELLARGQLETLTQTLGALSRESEPEKFLENVLATICRQVGAPSLGVWQVNEATGCVELLGNCDSGRLRLSTPEEILSAPRVLSPEREHPVWTEFFRSGRHCIWGEMDRVPARVRNLIGGEPAWHQWVTEDYAQSNVPALLQRLAESGIVANLSVPMFVAGRVSGFISIRFLEKRAVRAEEVELLRALAHQAMLAIQFIRLSLQSRAAAVAAERLRMAREVHDTLAQGATGVIVQLEAAEEALRQKLPGKVGECLSRAKEVTRESLRETRRLVQALRPHALAEGTLHEALESLVQKMSAEAGVRVEFSAEGERRALPPVWEDNLLRIAQEALTNALRHARAHTLSLRLRFAARAVSLSIADDGCGFDTASSHDGFGLQGMRERTEQMGGRFLLQSALEQGTIITIELPLADSP